MIVSNKDTILTGKLDERTTSHHVFWLEIRALPDLVGANVTVMAPSFQLIPFLYLIVVFC